MTVGELIAQLKRCPETLDVVMWGGEQDDDWVPVVEALYEDGTTHVAILPYATNSHPIHAYGSCGGVCDYCGDQP